MLLIDRDVGISIILRSFVIVQLDNTALCTITIIRIVVYVEISILACNEVLQLQANINYIRSCSLCLILEFVRLNIMAVIVRYDRRIKIFL